MIKNNDSSSFGAQISNSQYHNRSSSIGNNIKQNNIFIKKVMVDNETNTEEVYFKPINKKNNLKLRINKSNSKSKSLKFGLKKFKHRSNLIEISSTKEKLSKSSPHYFLPNKPRKKSISTVKIPFVKQNNKSSNILLTKKNKINRIIKISPKKTRILTSLIKGCFRNKNENISFNDFNKNNNSINCFNNHEYLYDQMLHQHSVKNKNNKHKNENNSVFLNKKSIKNSMDKATENNTNFNKKLPKQTNIIFNNKLIRETTKKLTKKKVNSNPKNANINIKFTKNEIPDSSNIIINENDNEALEQTYKKQTVSNFNNKYNFKYKTSDPKQKEKISNLFHLLKKKDYSEKEKYDIFMAFNLLNYQTNKEQEIYKALLEEYSNPCVYFSYNDKKEENKNYGMNNEEGIDIIKKDKKEKKMLKIKALI